MTTQPHVRSRHAGRLVAAAAVSIVVLSVVGLALPQTVIGDGLDGLSPRERAAAEEALEMMPVVLDHPISRAAVRRIHVESVRREPVRCAGRPVAGAMQGYRVVVTTHTFFAFRVGRFVACGTEISSV